MFNNIQWHASQTPWSCALEAGEIRVVEVATEFPHAMLSERLLMLENFRQGWIQVFGDYLHQLDPLRRDHALSQMGWIFRQPILISNLNLEDNLCLPFLTRALAAQQHLRQNALALTTQVTLKSPLTHRPHMALERDRLLITVLRSLVHEPKVIFSFFDWGELVDADVQRVMGVLMDHATRTQVSILFFQRQGRVHPSLSTFQRGPEIVCK